MDTQNVYACMDCGSRQPENTRCVQCSSDPLLDLRRPEVRQMLVDDDDARRSRRGDRVRYAAVPVAIVLVILIAFIPGSHMFLGILPFFMGYILAAALIAVGLMFGFKAIVPFKPRFPYARG